MSTNTALQTTKKPTNRAIQRLHETYKPIEGRSVKSQIAEGLLLLKPLVNESTYKFLRHFLYTDGGATQSSMKEWFEKTGVASSTYYDTAQHEIKGLFAEPLIITVKTTKKDKLGRKNPNGTPYKILQPLWKIKQLVNQFLEERSAEQRELMMQFEEPVGITSGITSGITPNAETPTESKAEPAFSDEQNKSIRENHLEKDLKINSNRETESVKQPTEKFGIKKPIQTFLDEDPFYKCFDEIKQRGLAKRIQLAFIKTDMDYTDVANQEVVLRTLKACTVRYEKEPENVKQDFYGACYKAFYKELNKQKQKNQEEEGEQPFLQSAHYDPTNKPFFYDWLNAEPQHAPQTPENNYEGKHSQGGQTTPHGANRHNERDVSHIEFINSWSWKENGKVYGAKAPTTTTSPEEVKEFLANLDDDDLPY